MRILLLGEYSNMHNTLAKALRKQGHDVTVVSDGDGWKKYPRDIDISRKDGFWGSLKIRWRMMREILPRLTGYDVVHLINPQWIDVNASLLDTFLYYLKNNNRVVSLGAYGDDYYVLKGQAEGVLKYSDTFNNGIAVNEEQNRDRVEKWTVVYKDICQKTAHEADCIIASLYEYAKLYDAAGFGDKLNYIGSPIDIEEDVKPKRISAKYRILIGEQTQRSFIKGTSIMAEVIDEISKTPLGERMEIETVKNVPFAQYQQLLKDCDILVDQLYSYTPAMNALEAMKFGTVVISGGEEDYYDFIGEDTLRPVINLRPDSKASNIEALKNVIGDASVFEKLSEESIEFVKKYHDSDYIAAEYVKVWEKILNPN